MKADIHIDDFCRDAALVLCHLYNAFPLPHTLYVEDIYGSEDTDEVGLHSRRYRACLGTMIWLAEEQLIQYQSLVYQQGIDQAVLSNRAFSLLTAEAPESRFANEIERNMPASLLRESRSWIGALRAALSSDDSENITVTVQHLLRNIPPRQAIQSTLPPSSPCESL